MYCSKINIIYGFRQSVKQETKMLVNIGRIANQIDKLKIKVDNLLKTTLIDNEKQFRLIL